MQGSINLVEFLDSTQLANCHSQLQGALLELLPKELTF